MSYICFATAAPNGYMITLKHKESLEPKWSWVLDMETKSDLAFILKAFGYKITSSAKKQDYIDAIASLLDKDPEALLRPLCWDSLTILKELADGKEGNFVKRPRPPRFRDIQTCSIVLTYIDGENGTEYYTIPSDVREALEPIISSYMASPLATAHRLVDPYIFGLTNLLGFCPLPLLNDYLEEFGVMGEKDGTVIHEDTAHNLIATSVFNYNKMAELRPGQIPAPYDKSDKPLIYFPSPAMMISNESIKELFTKQHFSGLIQREYRHFTEKEILDAGSLTPDFNFPEAVALKEYLDDEGYSEEHIKSKMTDFWLSQQKSCLDGEPPLAFKSKRLQMLYDGFIAHVPVWTDRGHTMAEAQAKIEEAAAGVKNIIDQRSRMAEEIDKGDLIEYLPVFTTRPAVKPEGDAEFRTRFIPGSTLEVTMDNGDGTYFVCYLTPFKDHSGIPGLYNMHALVSWGNLFDFVDDRYCNYNNELILPKPFIKKYKVLSSCLFVNPLCLKAGETGMTNMTVDNHRMQWMMARRFKEQAFDWNTILIEEDAAVFLMKDEIEALRSKCLALRNEIYKSDAKSLKADLKSMML